MPRKRAWDLVLHIHGHDPLGGNYRPRQGLADGTAHRILSDLSPLLGGRRVPHRLIVAGDWNLLRGYGENGDGYWKARYDTVFDRAEALGHGLSVPSTRTDAGRIRGQTSCQARVAVCRPFTTHVKHPQPQRGSSISCSPRHRLPTVSRSVRSTPQRRGDPAITVE